MYVNLFWCDIVYILKLSRIMSVEWTFVPFLRNRSSSLNTLYFISVTPKSEP